MTDAEVAEVQYKKLEVMASDIFNLQNAKMNLDAISRRPTTLRDSELAGIRQTADRLGNLLRAVEETAERYREDIARLRGGPELQPCPQAASSTGRSGMPGTEKSKALPVHEETERRPAYTPNQEVALRNAPRGACDV